MRPVPALGLAALVALSAVACAAREPVSLSERLVRQHTAGAAADEATFDDPNAIKAQTPPPQPPAVPIVPIAKSSSLPTIETEDPQLAAALAALAAVAPDDGGPLRAIAHEYRRLRIYDRAEDYFRQAIAVDRRDAAAYDGLARTWRDWGLPGVGLSHAHRAVWLAPESAEAQNTLGTILWLLGDVAAAEDRFARALALDPAATYAKNNLRRMQAARKNQEP